MVNDTAQLYTIEGIGAAILMVVTAYLVISSTTIFTPQDVHITDMQLQQLGSDALAMMDLADTYGGKSTLQLAIEEDKPELFIQNFSRLINATTSGRIDNLKFNTYIIYINSSSPDIQLHNFPSFPQNTIYLRENAVTATRWVFIDKNPPYIEPRVPPHHQVVLVEVLLWRN